MRKTLPETSTLAPCRVPRFKKCGRCMVVAPPSNVSRNVNSTFSYTVQEFPFALLRNLYSSPVLHNAPLYLRQRRIETSPTSRTSIQRQEGTIGKSATEKEEKKKKRTRKSRAYNGIERVVAPTALSTGPPGPFSPRFLQDYGHLYDLNL